MEVFAVGSRAFVTGLQLAGVSGIRVSSTEEALKQIERLCEDKEVGLVLVSEDMARPARDTLVQMRSRKPVPLIFEVPEPGGKGGKMEYRDMLKQILGM